MNKSRYLSFRRRVGVRLSFIIEEKTGLFSPPPPREVFLEHMQSILIRCCTRRTAHIAKIFCLISTANSLTSFNCTTLPGSFLVKVFELYKSIYIFFMQTYKNQQNVFCHLNTVLQFQNLESTK